jgi:tetratricopeptide (TPR) repeat protein
MVGLADCHYQEYELGKASVETAVAKAKYLLTTASEIDASAVDLRLTRAKVLGYCEWDWGEAEEEYLRAIEVEPGNAIARASYGKYLVRRGEHSKGLQQLRTSVQLDPLSVDVRKFYTDALFLAREYSRYMEAAEEGLRLHPGCWIMDVVMGRACLALGDHNRAVTHFRKAMLIAPGRRRLISADIAYAHAVAGDLQNALMHLSNLGMWAAAGQYVSPIAIAKISPCSWE